MRQIFGVSSVLTVCVFSHWNIHHVCRISWCNRSYCDLKKQYSKRPFNQYTYFVGQCIFVLGSSIRMARCFSFSSLLGLFLFTSTQYSCLRPTKSTAQSAQEAVWQGTRGSFSNIFFLSPPFLCIATLVSVGRGEEGVNQPPTSISNSLCSPHASRGSDLTLARRKADPLQCFTTRWSEQLHVWAASAHM